jgi:predicted nucleotidyltransferase
MIQLTPHDLAMLKQAFSGFLPTETEVYVFGSRAKGTVTRASDVDLLLKNTRPLTLTERAQVKNAIDITHLLYRVDIVDYHTLNSDFRAAIEPDLRLLNWQDADLSLLYDLLKKDLLS